MSNEPNENVNLDDWTRMQELDSRTWKKLVRRTIEPDATRVARLSAEDRLLERKQIRARQQQAKVTLDEHLNHLDIDDLLPLDDPDFMSMLHQLQMKVCPCTWCVDLHRSAIFSLLENQESVRCVMETRRKV
jgi:hypothetical protein